MSTASGEYPKLRPDLVIIQQEKSGPAAFVMKDPVSGRFFHFGELEGFIIRQLDGHATLGATAERVRERFETSVSPDVLRSFVARLDHLGLLDASTGRPEVAHRPRRIRGDPFYLRITLFDPDATLDRLVRPLRFLFTRPFLVISGTAILTALVITIGHWGEIQGDLIALFQYFSLVTAWLVLIAVIAAHEFAHGLTCKKYGGQVHDMGFLLLYFMPGFYCDVSDAWMFPQKSKRLLVMFAGGYFEVFIWSLATFVWLLTESPSAAHDVALVVMATSGIKTLFNFNPLIKLDGYYLLSDFLEIPNLRGKAIGHIKARFKSLLGLAGHDTRTGTPRERRAFLIYGLLAAAFSIWLTAAFLFHFGNYLMTEYKGWGFAAFGVFLAGLSRHRLTSLLRGWRAKLGFSGKGTTPRMTRIKIVALGAVAVVALGFVQMRLTVTGEFTLSPVHNADVRAEVSEIISEVLVDQGDSVASGDIIVRLSDRELNMQLRSIVAGIEETAAKLRLAKAGPRQEEITLSQTRVAKAEERLQFAVNDLERSEALLKRSILSQKEVETAKELVAVRKKELDEARGTLKILQLGSRQEEIEALEAELQALLAQRQYVESQLTLVTVRSPSTGVIVTPKLREKLGQHVSKGDLIATVLDLTTVVAEIVVSEKDIADVRVGQPVEIRARAYPSRTFHGTVNAIAPVTSEAGDFRDDMTVTVRAILDNSQLALKVGMSGNARIKGDKHRVFDLLVRNIYRFFKVEVWSWW